MTLSKTYRPHVHYTLTSRYILMLMCLDCKQGSHERTCVISVSESALLMVNGLALTVCVFW